MDTCIKAGTYCPVCKGIPSADCWHNASEFQRGANYSEKYFSALDQLKQLRAENTALKAKNERLKKRCFPSKVLMIGDAGHYVSEAVFVEMERLKAELAEAKENAERYAEVKNRAYVGISQQLAEALAACEERAKALRWYMPMMPIEHQYRINDILAIKPDASALKAHDDALIERIVGHLCENGFGNQNTFDAIRALKTEV